MGVGVGSWGDIGVTANVAPLAMSPGLTAGFRRALY